MWLLRFFGRIALEVISLALAIIVACGIYLVLSAIAAAIN